MYILMSHLFLCSLAVACEIVNKPVVNPQQVSSIDSTMIEWHKKQQKEAEEKLLKQSKSSNPIERRDAQALLKALHTVQTRFQESIAEQELTKASFETSSQRPIAALSKTIVLS